MMCDLDWDEGYAPAGDVYPRDALAVPPEMHARQRCMPARDAYLREMYARDACPRVVVPCQAARAVTRALKPSPPPEEEQVGTLSQVA